MKQGIILYRSKYGATKRYAAWLEEMTGYDRVETQKAAVEQVEGYGTLLLCGGVYASGIAGMPFLKRNIDRLKGKRIAVFCVGASPYDETALHMVKRHNMQGGLQEIPLFYGRGAWDESQMTFKDRALCRLLQKSLEKRDPSTYEPWMKALMDAAGQACDWTDRSYLAPLLEYLREP